MPILIQHLSIDNQAAGELNKPDVVLGVLLIADLELATAVVPGVGPLDDPTPSRMLLLTRLEVVRLATMTDVHDVLTVFASLPYGLVVISLVRTEVLRFVRRRFRPICQQTVQRVFGQRVVVFVRRS